MQRVTLNLFYPEGKPRGAGYREKLSGAGLSNSSTGSNQGPIQEKDNQILL